MTQFSLPAEPSASSIARRFIKEIAKGTNLSIGEVTDLQLAMTRDFNNALCHQKETGEGRIALRISVNADEITVKLVYRETHFPPAEFFSRS